MNSNGNCGEGDATRANCLNTIGSFMCECNEGFENKPICSDVNECLINNGGCGEGNVTRSSCINSPGSFRCECNEGFVDPPTCESPAASLEINSNLILILLLTTYIAELL